MSDKERYRRSLVEAERDSDGCLLIALVVIVAVVIGVVLLLEALPYA